MGRLRKPWRFAAVAAVVALVVILGVAYQAGRALKLARLQVAAADAIPATVQPFVASASADVQPVASPEVFRDAAVFRDHLFVGGPHGLIEYGPSGQVVSRLRAGLELPAGGVVALSTAVLASAATPALIVGTADAGVLTFDGQRWMHALAADVALRHVTALLPLSSGRLLIGTSARGLIMFDGRAFSRISADIGDVPITALAGREGDIWIGTTDRGAWHWHGGAVDRLDEAEGLPDNRVLALATRGQSVYVGTAVGVAEVTDGKYTRTLGEGLFGSAVALRDERLVVGTIDGTVAQIDLQARASRGVRPTSIDVPSPITRFAIAEGRLLAVSRDAVHEFADHSSALHRAVVADVAALSDGNISALSLDRNGRLWVGYFDRGLDILSAAGARVAHVENDRVFCVNRIVPDASGGLTAVATANGLVLFDAAAQPRQVLGRAQGLIADHITDVIAGDGAMTIATPAGLTFLDDEGSRSIYAFQGLVNNHVYALGAAAGDVFAGTLGGVSMLRQGVVRASYTTANSALTQNWITAVQRVDDTWFAGTYGAGVFQLDAAGVWHRFTDLPDVEINPNAMAVTDTHVFAGTLSHGLLVFERGRQRWTTYTRGLPSMNVTALVASDTGLYVGTDNGLIRLTAHAFAFP